MDRIDEHLDRIWGVIRSHRVNIREAEAIHHSSSSDATRESVHASDVGTLDGAPEIVRIELSERDALENKRTPIEATDIPDLLAQGPDREGPNSYGAPIDIMGESDGSLAASPDEPATTETVHHDAPASRDQQPELLTPVTKSGHSLATERYGDSFFRRLLRKLWLDF